MITVDKQQISLIIDEKLDEKLKKIKLDYDTSVPGGANYSYEEIVKILIENCYNELKAQRPRLFW